MCGTIWCWLIPALTGIICGILGYLLGKSLASRWQKKYNDLYVDFETYKKRVLELENELKACKVNKVDGFTTKISDLEAQLNACKSSKSSFNEDQWKLKLSNIESDLLSSKSKFASLEGDLGTKDKRITELEEELRLAKITVIAIPFDADAAKAVFGKKIKQDDLKIVEGIGPKIEGLFHDHGIKTWKVLSETSVEKCQEVLNSGGERYKVHNPKTWPQQSKMAYEGKWAELLKWQDELDGGK